MDIKAKIEELVEKFKSDPGFAEKFRSDPIQAVEGVLGVDLPDDQIKAVADGIKAKVSVDSVKNALGGLFGKN